MQGRRTIPKSVKIKRKSNKQEIRQDKRNIQSAIQMVAIAIKNPTISPMTTPASAPHIATHNPIKYARIQTMDQNHARSPNPIKAPEIAPTISPPTVNTIISASGPIIGIWKNNANINDIQRRIVTHIGEVIRRIAPAITHHASARIIPIG